MLQRIDARMAELGVKPAQVLREAGLEQSYLKGLRNKQVPGLFKAAALARRLNCSLDYLAGAIPDSAPPLNSEMFVRVVARVIELIARESLTMPPEEAAEMALHIYSDAGETDRDLSDAVIRWLSGSKRK